MSPQAGETPDETTEAERPGEHGDSASQLLVPVLTFGVTIAILSARALTILLPVMAVDLHTSMAVMGQIPAVMLLLAGALALVTLLASALPAHSPST